MKPTSRHWRRFPLQFPVALSIITLALFVVVVFVSGFVIKAAFKLLWAVIAGDTGEADSIYEELDIDMLTWRYMLALANQ